MSANIVVPEVGESIVDARVARWLKKAGDTVAAGEPLVELETDKVDVEVAAPKAGVLQSIAHGDGADVKIGDVLGVIDTDAAGKRDDGKSEVRSQKAEVKVQKTESTRQESKKQENGKTEARTPESTPAPVAARAPEPLPARAGSNVSATPSARRLAREQQISLSSISSSGGRVTRDDVQKAATKSPAPGAPVAPAPEAPAARSETRSRMSKRRATIARRLVEAQRVAALLTTFNEVDMSAVMAVRERQKDAFKAKHGVGLGIASFFIKAAVAALAEFPRLNAEIDGDEIVLKHFYDIGVAVGAADGLVVPVIRDADSLSFAQIEQRIRDFAARAGNGTLTLDDLRGGTFSVTNGGVYGSLMSTPIVNPPQVGILGLHAIKERPTGVNGQVVLRPMMYIALTYDHRIVDGAEAVRFLVRVKELVEEPALLLVES
ncbi:MAG TPA: 2-oxoglutarate dehydrogenase complex dihydrolipoyllysine-residue succinyltransferase [Vicinamibacterales bacterium]|nr:2-oxoglutarate dehydrogenase complex dihydrolipoyllysine-residue succinyltransferase [Vicinamibacterales bacterium]